MHHLMVPVMVPVLVLVLVLVLVPVQHRRVGEVEGCIPMGGTPTPEASAGDSAESPGTGGHRGPSRRRRPRVAHRRPRLGCEDAHAQRRPQVT